MGIAAHLQKNLGRVCVDEVRISVFRDPLYQAYQLSLSIQFSKAWILRFSSPDLSLVLCLLAFLHKIKEIGLLCFSGILLK